MNLTEVKEVSELKEVIVGHKCDNCGKVHKGQFHNDWHKFASHHNEWGNDSIDSYESYDVCSPECYVEKLSDVVEGKMSDIYDGEIDEMDIQFARRMVEYFKRVGKNNNSLCTPKINKREDKLDQFDAQSKASFQ